MTEAAIAAAVTSHPEVGKAHRAAIEAGLAADKAEAVAKGFDHRKPMIETEVKLWLSNYWGDVKVMERDMKGVTEDAKEAKVNEGLRRRRSAGTQEA